jgi:hypothetical protein
LKILILIRFQVKNLLRSTTKINQRNQDIDIYKSRLEHPSSLLIY